MSAAILTLLTTLAALQAQLAASQAAQATALPQYLKDRVARIAAQYAPEQTALAAQIAHCTQSVKTAVLRHGKTVKGQQLIAVYRPGRLTWDSAALSGYAVEHPEILLLASEGAPSVTLRQVQEART